MISPVMRPPEPAILLEAVGQSKGKLILLMIADNIPTGCAPGETARSGSEAGPSKIMAWDEPDPLGIQGVN